MVQLSKADAILHPVRIRIVRSLASGASGRRLTARQIGEELPDVSQATLYRHLKGLVEIGVVEIVDQHDVRGTVERVYGLPVGGAVLDADDVRHLSRDEHMRYFTTFAAGLLGDFARYLQRDSIDFARDGVGYRQEVFYLSDDEMAEFLRNLGSVVMPVLQNGPAPGRKRRMLTTVMMPTDEPQEPTESDRKD